MDGMDGVKESSFYFFEKHFFMKLSMLKCLMYRYHPPMNVIRDLAVLKYSASNIITRLCLKPTNAERKIFIYFL